ncbi:MAG: DUF5916 domain-containing protein [Candidatus Baltobacteraceae bacterium]
MASALPAAPSLEGDGGWAGVSSIQLAWDYTNGRTATEPAAAQLAVAGNDLFVRFSVPQRAPIVATQHVNDVGDGSDDEVEVYLWPTGSNGFRYQFNATPSGTHYQYSTENNVYAPTWTSRGRIRANGYDVTMQIPLSALRSDGRGTWKVQFARVIHQSGESDEWSHGSGQANLASSVFAGKLGGLAGVTRAARTKPRFGVYTLAAGAGASAGGSTSRMGADIAYPITATASLVATIHPDFSNVEQDQQTISPTAFQRHFNEVRPFFSQAAANIYSGNCSGCPNINELYTPAIPTPRDGYALEGTQGPFSVGAFDAVGNGRNDTAETINYVTPNRKFEVWQTRVSADLPGVHDDTQLLAASYDTLAHYSAYFDYGNDSGSLVHDASQAQRYDGGVAYYTKDDYDSFTMRKIGQYYNPYDGLVSLTDIAGYSAQLNHTFQFGPKKRFQWMSVNLFNDRYAGQTGGLDLVDQYASVTLATRTQFSLIAQTGSQFVRLPGLPLLPDTLMTVGAQYQVNTALQSNVLYNFGAFAHGRLVFLQRDGAIKVFRRATLSFNLDSTDYKGSDGHDVQWLERVGVAFDLGPRSSLSIGARKIVGIPPPLPVQPFVSATNLSVGYSKRFAHDELYFVYGDASMLRTYPATQLKWIHYFGAEKGT